MNKLTKEQIIEIKELREKHTIEFLAREYRVSKSTIRYHLDKEKSKKSYKKWYSSLSKERRNEIFKTNKEKAREYQRKRYKEDENYREYKKNAVKTYRAKQKLNLVEEVVKGGNK